MSTATALPATARGLAAGLCLAALPWVAPAASARQAEAAPPAAATTAAPNTRGFLYGTVTTERASYRGRLRWGGEEAFWGDHFNAAKTELPHARAVPRDARRRRQPIKVFGVTIGVNWEERIGSRQLVARFGDIQRLEPHRGGATLIMKGGSRYRVEDASNDFGGAITVWDAERGEVEVAWRDIERVDFQPAPAALAVDGHRLHGTVDTDAGSFTGFIQWDGDECLSTDVLDGEGGDGRLRIPFGNIRAIERRSRSSARIVLHDGRDLVLSDNKDVDSGNYGIFVEDQRFGRVLVPWDAFARATFDPPGPSGPGYEAFPAAAPLRGTVTARGGQQHRGKIVWDVDESETWELLNGEQRGIAYSIPFTLVARVEPRGAHGSRVTLVNGTTLDLEEAVDVTESNAGLIVLDDGENSVYVPWDEVERVDFTR